MSARTMLQNMLMKSATVMNPEAPAGAAAQAPSAAPSGGQPQTDAPTTPEHPGNPEAFSTGQGPAAVKTAGEGLHSVKAFLRKTAGLSKTAAPRPGRLDGDISLGKLASLHCSKKKKKK